MPQYGKKPHYQNMRATSHAPPERGTFRHPEESPLVKDLRVQLKDVQRAHQEQLHINSKQKQRLRELEAANQVSQDVQISLEENPLVKDLRRQLQGQRTRLQKLEEQVQDKKALERKVEELQKQLSEAREEKETIMEFGKNLLKQKDEEREQMIEQGRQMVNEYVDNLYQENNNLKRFSQEQQALALRNQAKVEELEKQLKEQRGNSHYYNADVFEELEYARDTIEKQEVAMMEMTKKLKRYKKKKRALESTLQETTEVVESKDQLLVSIQQELQKEQEEKQALERKITVLESALTEQRRTAEEALKAQVLSIESTIAGDRRAAEEAWNKKVLSLESALTEQRQTAEKAEKKSQMLDESLNIERSKVQTLHNYLDSRKKAFKIVLEKCYATHKALVEESSLHTQTIKELNTALSHSEEEKTSALLRCEDLQMTLKESGDQLQQTKARVEELQAELDKKNKKKRRRWFNCWQ